MKVLVIGNFSDRRCGFQNFSVQTVTALQRAGVEVTRWDGTYSSVKALTDLGHPGFFPDDIAQYDVVHVIWNAMTLNHYSGADWSLVRGKISWWDGGPSDASCPFIDSMQIRWSDYPREGYHYLHYPVPDWVEALPAPADQFTVGLSSVRGDGRALVEDICQRHGWALNANTPGEWIPLEDEIRRLARSTVNVCWYNTPPIWHNRASAPSMLLASGRPLVINDDPLVAHLRDATDIYRVPVRGTEGAPLEDILVKLHARWGDPGLVPPVITADHLSWTKAAQHMLEIWA